MRGEDVLGLVDHARRIEPSVRAAIRELTQATESIAKEIDKEREETRRQVEVLEAQVIRLRKDLAITQRMRDRFRYALWIYIQERDGLLGVHAPSLDTLKRIRELLEEQLDS